MNLKPFEYVEAKSVEDALEALSAYGDGARVIAGGTVVVPLMKMRMVQPEALVSLSSVEGLAGVRAEGSALSVGALATHRAVSMSAAVHDHAPLLARACGRVASPVIRSMGTLGGNLCHGESASDPPSALLALGGSIRLRGPAGERVVPVEEFFLGFYETAIGPEEVLTHVEVRRQPPGARWRYLKWTPRAREDKPLVGLAALLEMEDGTCRRASLAVGGVADRPVRLDRASAALSGRRVDEPAIAEAAEAAAAEAEPIDDLQASAGYRRDMLRVWVARTLRDMAEDQAEEPTRLEESA
ncbi:MAG: xanthine dehydrogenase family protein subunit M [Actinomycetota bacterium]|nr:xanthine dehydrogenase family protein subunit M [Actinomycetota bacterium]